MSPATVFEAASLKFHVCAHLLRSGIGYDYVLLAGARRMRDRPQISAPIARQLAVAPTSRTVVPPIRLPCSGTSEEAYWQQWGEALSDVPEDESSTEFQAWEMRITTLMSALDSESLRAIAVATEERILNTPNPSFRLEESRPALAPLPLVLAEISAALRKLDALEENIGIRASEDDLFSDILTVATEQGWSHQSLELLSSQLGTVARFAMELVDGGRKRADAITATLRIWPVAQCMATQLQAFRAIGGDEALIESILAEPTENRNPGTRQSGLSDRGNSELRSIYQGLGKLTVGGRDWTICRDAVAWHLYSCLSFTAVSRIAERAPIKTPIRATLEKLLRRHTTLGDAVLKSNVGLILRAVEQSSSVMGAVHDRDDQRSHVSAELYSAVCRYRYDGATSFSSYCSRALESVGRREARRSNSLVSGTHQQLQQARMVMAHMRSASVGALSGVSDTDLIKDAAEKFGMRFWQVKELMELGEINARSIHLDAPAFDDSDAPCHELVADAQASEPNCTLDAQSAAAMLKVWNELSPARKLMIQRTLGMGEVRNGAAGRFYRTSTADLLNKISVHLKKSQFATGLTVTVGRHAVRKSASSATQRDVALSKQDIDTSAEA